MKDVTVTLHVPGDPYLLPIATFDVDGVQRRCAVPEELPVRGQPLPPRDIAQLLAEVARIWREEYEVMHGSND